ncbi:MAG: hypothetical protein JST01_00140 [Cyanobacteria bacterium SZAS TMP-1]|nr:hypothetical protein [Cyanobacteria bacterium SZAS TMP-1]
MDKETEGIENKIGPIPRLALGIFCFVFIGCLTALIPMGLIAVLVERPPKYYSLDIIGDPPVLTFYEGGFQEMNKFTGIEFYENAPPTGAAEKIWSIHPTTTTASGAFTKKVDYGKVPDGWLQDFPAKPISMVKGHKIVFVTWHGDCSFNIPGTVDWKTRGLRSEK